MRVEPDEGRAQSHQRNAQPGPGEPRKGEQEFGVHAVQESHGGTIGNEQAATGIQSPPQRSKHRGRRGVYRATVASRTIASTNGAASNRTGSVAGNPVSSAALATASRAAFSSMS